MEPCLIAFFLNDTATTEIYTLSLHDALPISVDDDHEVGEVHGGDAAVVQLDEGVAAEGVEEDLIEDDDGGGVRTRGGVLRAEGRDGGARPVRGVAAAEGIPHALHGLGPHGARDGGGPAPGGGV